MKRNLYLDIETFSSVDIADCGSYKYFESLDFEILMIAYAFDNGPEQIIDLTEEGFPNWLKEALVDPTIDKHAHNANFERRAFISYGIETPIEQWHCSAVKAAYCGLPLSLDGVSKALKFDTSVAKSSDGKALIKYFSCPVKPTKVNGMRTRNLPEHAPDKWERFKDYCKLDVKAEREVLRRLDKYELPELERFNYILDQEINDRGILIDLTMAQNAYEIDNLFSAELDIKLQQLTGLDNANSPKQLASWLSRETGTEVTSIAKEAIEAMLEGCTNLKVKEALEIRQIGGKTSTKKYLAMLNCACDDNRARGLFQFYGANRTGRWAGRLIQLQNLPKNFLKSLASARDIVAKGDYELIRMLYDDIPSVLSQLIRTAFVAKPGHTFAVADFSAIEARVIAWLSDEKWRLNVFNTHGKIYEASASKMFKVPIESVTKDSDYRARGKVAELALGYQGSVGAIIKMDKKKELKESEMPGIVKRWRLASPAIVQLWADIESCAIRAVQYKKKVVSIHKNLEFDCNEEVLTIKLPSGRKLFYQSPSLTKNKWDKTSIRYKGMNQETKQWGYVDTYGGKLVENIVQAIARDLLAEAMLRVNERGFKIVLHVHDEEVCEVPLEGSEAKLKELCSIMGESVSWAPGLPLTADGYLTPFYKKD
jgi:DNA polymerase